MTTIEYLDAIRLRFSLPSDYQAAKLLGCTRAAASKYRQGGSFFCDETALKVAELLEIPAGQVLADIAAERTKCPEAKKAWEQAARHLSGVAASLFLAAILVFSASSGTAEAAPGGAAFSKTSGSLYIMSNSLRGYMVDRHQEASSYQRILLIMLYSQHHLCLAPLITSYEPHNAATPLPATNH